MGAVAEYVAQKIQEIRKSKNLTQSQLAKKLKVTPNTVSRWESGVYKPKIEDLERLSRVLENPIWAFFPSELTPERPTAAQRALLSKTGDLPEEDLNELVRYADFVRARKAYRAKTKRKTKKRSAR
jgi:transcriptional regulator with XRE-family HTH domain